MQNETNLPTPKMNITPALTRDYQNQQPCAPAKTKPILVRLWRIYPPFTRRTRARGFTLAKPAQFSPPHSRNPAFNFALWLYTFHFNLQIPPRIPKRASQNKIFKTFSNFSNSSTRNSPDLRAFFPNFSRTFQRFRMFPHSPPETRAAKRPTPDAEP